MFLSSLRFLAVVIILLLNMLIGYISCRRDWFQLTLKEGLTVFREQLFGADMGSPAVSRINDVESVRSDQVRI